MSEILLQTAIIAMFINLVSLFDDFETRKFFTLVSLCIISTLIKPVMAIFAAIILLLGIFFWIRKKKTVILALSMTPLLFLFLFGLSNKQKTGYFEISSISTALLYNYNAYNTLQNVYGQAKADSLMSLSDSISSRFSTYKERSEFLRETSIQTILSNFPAYIELHLKGMAFIFLDPGRFDIYTFLNKEKTEGRGFLFHLSNDGLNGALTYLRTMDGLLITILIFFLLINCLKLLLLALSFFNNQIPPSIRAASIILIGYIAIIVGPSGCSRFMVPVVLIYNLMAVFQLIAIRNKYKSIANR
jgi:hypothetical protein